jgi:hypothetical protein
MFYEEAALIYPEPALEWLIQPGGRWDNEEGFSFLLQKAKIKFGIDSVQYRILMVLWQRAKVE